MTERLRGNYAFETQRCISKILAGYVMLGFK
jgi:hypothetical protein